jgi:HEAT repeat protein
MPAEFEALLAALADDSQPFPLELLPELSDLDASRMDRLRAVWTTIGDERRLKLVESLGDLADDQIEFTFERVNRFAMEDALPAIRARAIRNLWECEDPSLIAPLAAALSTDSVADVRAAASAALGAFLFLGETHSLPGDLLHRIEEALLASANEDAEDEVRLCSLESLGYSSRQEVPPLIDNAYGTQSEPWVRAALVAMGRSASKPWGPKVIHELTSPIPSLRLEAARAAGELDLQEAVPSLIDLLEDVSDEIRRAAIWSLGQLGGRAANEALLSALDRSEDDDEIELIEDALGNLAFVDGTRDFLMFDFDDTEDGAG